MNRNSKIDCTKTFYNEYGSICHNFSHGNFLSYWLYPFINKVYTNRDEAYKVIDSFIEKVKKEFNQDYGNHVIPYIKEEWFCVVDYKEENDE